MPDEPIITPIGAPKNQTNAPISARAQKRSFARDMDSLVCGLAFLMALMTFGLSVYFFYGFTQTDQGFWTLASAFGLCFGVGSLAYIPCGIIAVIARRSAKQRVSRKALAFALLLLMPWVFVALIFTGWSALPKVYGVFALFLSTGLSLWAVSRLGILPKK